jgi:hypothetical protein
MALRKFNSNGIDVLNLANTTPSTSNTTGTLTVAGGVGVAGNLYATSVYASNYYYTTGSLSAGVSILNDISNQFDGSKTHFQLKTEQSPINIETDSKNFEVVVDGRRLNPYVTRYTYPWLTPYDSFKGFRVRTFRDLSNVISNYVTIYNAPYIGDSSTISLRTPTTTTFQTTRYPFSATTIALGD